MYRTLSLLSRRNHIFLKPSWNNPILRLRSLSTSLGNNNATNNEIHDRDTSGAEESRITWVGLYSNVGLTIAKGIVAFQSGSASLMADAAHSASDICSDAVALAAIKYSRKPPDALHPFGYGHYETLATLGVSAVLIGGGIGIGHHAFETMLGTQPPLQMVSAAMGVAFLSVVVKEWLFRETEKIGLKTHSPVVALVGIAGSAVGIPQLDPVAGLLVSGMILKAGAELAWDGIQDLTDRQRSSDSTIIHGVYEIARDMAAQDGSGVVDVHDVRVRHLGHYLILDFHLYVDPRLSVTAGYWEKNRIKRKILNAYPNVSEIFVHVQAHPSRSTENTSTLKRSLSVVWPRRNESFVRPVKRKFEKTARSHFEIEKDIRQNIEELRKVEPMIHGVSHVLVHYDVGHGSRPRIHVEVNLRMDLNMTLLRAERIARVARDELLRIEDIDSIDIHLELLDGES